MRTSSSTGIIKDAILMQHNNNLRMSLSILSGRTYILQQTRRAVMMIHIYCPFSHVFILYSRTADMYRYKSKLSIPPLSIATCCGTNYRQIQNKLQCSLNDGSISGPEKRNKRFRPRVTRRSITTNFNSKTENDNFSRKQLSLNQTKGP